MNSSSFFPSVVVIEGGDSDSDGDVGGGEC